MMGEAAPRSFPRAPLIGAAGVIAMTILAAATGRMTGSGSGSGASPGKPLLARDLRFADQRDGGVAVFDASNGRMIDELAPGTNGFVRATMRGLAAQRLRESLGPDQPFRLIAWRDGRLTLDDPATGRQVELEAFGHTNEAAFAQLLVAQAPAR